jgi:hypothetical protein
MMNVLLMLYGAGVVYYTAYYSWLMGGFGLEAVTAALWWPIDDLDYYLGE